ncbi:MAG: GGDEF domain-containing protein [Ruminococcus sp.]|nr:GGDEF domain-containing protein [Ruminococcus sp.]
MSKMSAERNARFSALFQELVSSMTNFSSISVPKIESLLNELAALLRLSKGITHVYRNPREEDEGRGETLISYDNGKEGKLIHSVRVVTSVMSIVCMEVFQSPDEPPLSDDEQEKLDLVMRTSVSFISRNRLRDIVEELAFFDDAGYRNSRSMDTYLYNCHGKGKLDGKAAIHYNLRHFTLVNLEIGRRNADVVMKNHYKSVEALLADRGSVFRLGGDNFVAFFDADRLSDVLRYLNESKIVYDRDGSSVSLSCSVGVFMIPEGFTMHNNGEVMEKIISASHAAQTGGQDNIVYFDSTIIKRKEKSMKVQQLFPEAMRNEEFRVFYQPKVNIETGELCGAEALCRWFRKGEIVPPGDFIPMLEETNDICRLDLYMLEHVCRDIKRWLDEGRKVVRVSVNLSRKHMMNSDLLSTITGIIDRCGISHEYIEIELTETTTDVEFSDLKRVVSGLQQKGIATSVDDFGIGYSSLNLIRAIPWNVLKIDRSFLPAGEDIQYPQRCIMFRHVIAMARELGLECIAEGVETQEQLNMIRENNCGIAQGFLFDRPLPVEEFENRLSRHYYEVPL